MRLHSIVALALSAVALAACGSDSSTGPASVNGTWSYSANALTENGASCSISGLSMDMSQSGATITGSTSGGTLSCVDGTGNPLVSSGVPAFTITGSFTSNTDITFTFTNQQITGNAILSTATVSGHTMNGTTTLAVTIIDNGTGTQVTLNVTGAFTATM